LPATLPVTKLVSFTENRRVVDVGENITVKVAFDRTTDAESPHQPSDMSDQAAHAGLPEDDWDEPSGPSNQSESLEQPQEQSPVVAQDHHSSPEHFQRQASDDWRNAPNIEDWSEEVSKEMPSPEAVANTGKFQTFSI
jgi:hypothetical protein